MTLEELVMVIESLNSKLDVVAQNYDQMRVESHGITELIQSARVEIQRSMARIQADFDHLSGYCMNIVALSIILARHKIISVDELEAEVKRQGPKLLDELKFKRILRESGFGETGSPSPNK